MEIIETKPRNIIFFDGLCHLCDGFVDLVIQQDHRRQFHFAPLQGVTAQKLLPEIDRIEPDSIVYMEGSKLYYRSSAVMKILVRLGGIFYLFVALKFIPEVIRDFAYNNLAKNRYKFFGKKDSCRIPESHEKDYLLP